MKKLILLTALIFSTYTTAQDTQTIGLYQDGKLAFFKDDAGNYPFTLDIMARFELQMMQKKEKSYFYAIIVEAEYADLYGGDFRRFSAGASITFNKWFQQSKFFKKTEYSLAVMPLSFIWRDDFKDSFLNNFAVSGKIAYRLGKNWKAAFLYEIIKREDLRSTYKLNDWQDYVKPNFYWGIEYVF